MRMHAIETQDDLYRYRLRSKISFSLSCCAVLGAALILMPPFDIWNALAPGYRAFGIVGVAALGLVCIVTALLSLHHLNDLMPLSDDEQRNLFEGYCADYPEVKAFRDSITLMNREIIQRDLKQVEAWLNKQERTERNARVFEWVSHFRKLMAVRIG